MIFPRWRQSLARSLHVQRSKPEAKFFQAANAYMPDDSCDINDIVVENRTMVFRGFAQSSHTLLAISDSRSEKFSQWQQSPRTQLCWYFTKTREQFRISAQVSMVGSSGLLFQDEHADADVNQGGSQNSILTSERAILWANLSDKAKMQFYWPAPKQALKDIEINGTPSSDIPDNFILICFHPHHIDYLNLTTTPQTREIHDISDKKWIYQAVNP